MTTTQTNLCIIEDPNNTSCGTSLEKEIRVFVRKYNRQLIPLENVTLLKNEIAEEVVRLLAEHKAWKPLDVNFGKNPYQDFHYIKIGDVYLYIRPANGILTK